MTYEEAQEYVAALPPRGWRLGLERMAEFARRAGLDRLDSNFVHVAGTNGKGSVTAYLQSIFIEAGFTTGAFFSPFVYDPRERVQVGRELISRADFSRLVSMLKPVADSLSDSEYGGISEFEMKTAVGFAYWQERACEWVALEVGLGGRYDSTNIITPRASVITSIGLDHVAILGDTYAQIASEKAGVIKQGVPVVVGAVPDEAMEVIRAEAAGKCAPMWGLGQEISVRLEGGGYCVTTPERLVAGLSPGLIGVKQPENMALAVSACLAAGLELPDSIFRRAVQKAFVPGRFEVRTVQDQMIILDGAHNGEAAEVLAQTLEDRFPGQRFALITGMVAGHDPARFYGPLTGKIDEVFITPIDFHRAVSPDELAQSLRSVFPSAETCGSPKDALERALQTELPILVTGSFYLVGEVGNYLGFGT